MTKQFRFFNTLNFDTALGAVAIASFVSSVSGHPVVWSSYVALLLSVLAIYNFDHLIDALMLKEDALTFRHSFYQRHFIALIYWQLFLVISGAVMVMFLPAQVLLAGIGMIFLMSIYFWLILKALKNNLIYREIFVALGYTMAVSIVPVFSTSIFTPRLFGVVTIIFLIALSNLWVFAIYELEIDNTEHRHSIAKSISKRGFRNLTRVLIFVTVALIGVFSFYFSFWFAGRIHGIKG